MKAISMCWMSLRFFVFLLFAFTANAAGSQSVATYRAETRLVEVATTVFDHHGHFVDGLDAKDFEILDNGVPQKIKYFANNTESLSCAILLDTTGSMDKVLPRLKNSVVTLVEAFGPKDRFAIYSFDEQLHTDQEFTGDKAAAKRAVLRLRAAGATALFDALAEATLDCRLLPGQNAEEFVSEVKARINDPRVIVEQLSEPADPSPSRSDTPLYAAIRKAILTYHPNAIVMPVLVPYGTDNQKFRLKGAIGYGFMPMVVDAATMATMHSDSEHLPVDQFRIGLHIYYDLLRSDF